PHLLKVRKRVAANAHQLKRIPNCISADTYPSAIAHQKNAHKHVFLTKTTSSYSDNLASETTGCSLNSSIRHVCGSGDAIADLWKIGTKKYKQIVAH
ncbi:hypothetical protein MAR_007804, partial [Mya arenaria]